MPRIKPRVVQTTLVDRPGRWKLLMRRQRKLLRQTAVASVGVVALLGIVITANVLGHGSSMRERLGNATAGIGLTIQAVTIEGQEKTPQKLLEKTLAARVGTPILSFSVADARTRLEGIPWVRSAIVERVLPNTIHVVLNERRPFAVWQNQGKFTLIDQAGNIVTDSNISDFADKLPLVVGIGAPLEAAALLKSLDAYPVLEAHLVAAVRVGERRWDLCMNSGANVQLPEGAEIPALAKLMELQTSKAILDRPLQVIDLRLPDRLRIRPMAEGPCGQGRSNAAAPIQAPITPMRKAT